MVTKQPFLAEIRAAVQPVGTFRQAYVNLKEKWQQAVPNPEPDLAQISEDEDENEDEGEDEDDQLNSDGDETEAGEMEGSEDTWESVDHSTPRAFSGPPSEKMIKYLIFFGSPFVKLSLCRPIYMQSKKWPLKNCTIGSNGLRKKRQPGRVLGLLCNELGHP